MKSNKAYTILLSVSVAYLAVLLVMMIVRPVSKDKDVAHIINSGLQLLEKDTLYLESSKNTSEKLSDAKHLFEKAHSLNPDELYAKYCAGLANYCTGDTEKADEILGGKYISPECSLIQSEICLQKGDTSALICILATTIEHQPDYIECEFFQNLARKDSAICQKAVAMAKLHLTADKAHTQDPIKMAKIGKILLSQRQTDSAELYLTKTISLLRNMNRPYLYLSMIALTNGDTAQYEKNLKIAEHLDGSDPLPYALQRYVDGKPQPVKTGGTFKLPLRFEYAYGVTFRKNAIIVDEISDMVRPRFEYFMALF